MSNSDRIEEILALPEASNRTKLASYIADQTNCTVSEARGILKASPPDGEDGEDDGSAITGLAKSFRLTKFAPANGN